MGFERTVQIPIHELTRLYLTELDLFGSPVFQAGAICTAHVVCLGF